MSHAMEGWLGAASPADRPRALRARSASTRPGIPVNLTALRTAFPNSRAWLCALRARCPLPARTS